ncbi:MAG: hypothetical protein BJ554DRAFT_1651 [Olpidium bornovanus]|uniref:Uncharacterized protein n=1 Tax=Olpidium bornovanus TaxID=278681 RepID=A0A8H7ZRR2_9FUNG|nr:MAG: hypothetical protein BJ554DRAFT_1651 [Olpidium bornovanus]
MPLPRNKAVDLTETAGDGLLSEMSIVELQLRLAIVKETVAKEEEKRRQEILEQKKQQEKAIADKLRSIQEYRIVASKKSKSAVADYRIAGKSSYAQTESHGRRAPAKQAPGVSFSEPTENREPPDVSAASQAKIRKIMVLTEKLASKKKEQRGRDPAGRRRLLAQFVDLTSAFDLVAFAEVERVVAPAAADVHVLRGGLLQLRDPSVEAERHGHLPEGSQGRPVQVV